MVPGLILERIVLEQFIYKIMNTNISFKSKMCQMLEYCILVIHSEISGVKGYKVMKISHNANCGDDLINFIKEK